MRALVAGTCLFLLLGADLSCAQRLGSASVVASAETDALTRTRQIRASVPLSASGRSRSEQMSRGGSLYSLGGSGVVVPDHRHIRSILLARELGRGGRRTFGVRSDRWLLDDSGVHRGTVALRSFPGTFSSCYSSPITASDSLEAGSGPWGKRERIVLGTLFLVTGVGALGVGVGGSIWLVSFLSEADMDQRKGLGDIALIMLPVFGAAVLGTLLGGVYFTVQGVRLLQGKDLWIPGESGGDAPPPPPLHSSSQPSLFRLSISL